MIVLLTALPAEARPLIEHFDLSALETANPARVRLYTGADCRLVVAGTGSHAAAAAVGYAAAALGTARHAAWINIGIAGSPTLEPGTAIIADRLIDGGTGMTAYPFLPPGVEAETASVTTVAEPDTEYRHAGAVDMEAWGFFAAATRFTTLEQVQCMKVISDGPRHPAARLDGAAISALVAARVPLLRTLVNALGRQAHVLGEPTAARDLAAQLAERWHTTASQLQALTEQLARWQALLPADDPRREVIGAPTAAAAVATLRARLDALPPAAGTRAAAP